MIYGKIVFWVYADKLNVISNTKFHCEPILYDKDCVIKREYMLFYDSSQFSYGVYDAFDDIIIDKIKSIT